MNITYFQAT